MNKFCKTIKYGRLYEYSNILKVAVIDSGLSESLQISLGNRVVGGFSYAVDRNAVERQIDFFDNCGHGTACTSIISKLAPNTQFYIVKILDESGKTNSNILIKALNDLAKSDIDIINLSVSTGTVEHYAELQKVCHELMLEGKIIISSKMNFGSNSSYPAILDSVIGIEGGIFCNTGIIWFNKNRPIQCVADSSPSIIRTGENEYIIGKRNSKATAVVTGIVRFL